MANRDSRFLIKRSNVPGKIPTEGDILLGELALNTADAILYTSGTTENQILPIGWDRVHRTGDTMTGDLTLSGASLLNVDYIDFNIGYTGNTTVEGRIYWDENNQTLSLGMHNSNVLQQIGQEIYYLIKNQSGATIENGRVVKAVGTLGSSGRILGEYMIADGSVPAKFTLGLATQDIVNGDDGLVTEFGLVRGIDATGTPYGETWNNGDVLYVSPTIAGGLTKIEPISPDLRIEIALVIDNSANGSVFVRPHRYPYSNDLQDFGWSAGTESNLDIIQWNSSLGYFDLTNTPSFNSVSATTFYGDGSNLTGIVSSDSYVTGVTISDGTLSLSRNNGLSTLTASTKTTRELTFNSNDMALNTATRTTLTPLVMSVTRFSGLGAVDDAGVSFIIPNDYYDTPQFYFTWRAASTSANNAKISLDLYTGSTDNLGALTSSVETLSILTTPTNTNTFIFTSAATSNVIFNGGDTVHLRVYRDPGDGADTYTGDLDMINLNFKYNSIS